MNKLIEQKRLIVGVDGKIPILKNLPHGNFPFNLGALVLSVDGRNCVFDSVRTVSRTNRKKGQNVRFSTTLSADFETFEKSKEYNYELTVDDLRYKDLKATFFCSDDDYELENAFDFDTAELECSIRIENKTYRITKVEFE